MAHRTTLAATFLFVALLLPMSAQAAKWQQLAGYGSSYIDVESVRGDEFPKMSPTGITQFVNGQLPIERVTVAWLWLIDEGVSSRIEVAFDCQGSMAVIQQLIIHQTPKSPYQSFDNTASFRQGGLQKRSVPPDTTYEAAEKIACKLKPPRAK